MMEKYFALNCRNDRRGNLEDASQQEQGAAPLIFVGVPGLVLFMRSRFF